MVNGTSNDLWLIFCEYGKPCELLKLFTVVTEPNTCGSSVWNKLEDTARYAGFLLAPAEGFGLRPRLFLLFGNKCPASTQLFLLFVCFVYSLLLNLQLFCKIQFQCILKPTNIKHIITFAVAFLSTATLLVLYLALLPAGRSNGPTLRTLSNISTLWPVGPLSTVGRSHLIWLIHLLALHWPKYLIDSWYFLSDNCPTL